MANEQSNHGRRPMTIAETSDAVFANWGNWVNEEPVRRAELDGLEDPELALHEGLRQYEEFLDDEDERFRDQTVEEVIASVAHGQDPLSEVDVSWELDS